MKDIAVYFTQDEYTDYQNGHSAIGFTADQKTELEDLERTGIDCGLNSDPLSQMTKVRSMNVREVEWSDFGVYASKVRKTF